MQNAIACDFLSVKTVANALRLGLCVSKRILKLMGNEESRNEFINVKKFLLNLNF